MEKIVGLIDAPFTPFYANGDVNLEPIEAYAKMLQKNGLKGVFINGSSGEGYMLTTEERMQLAERWVSVAPRGALSALARCAVYLRCGNEETSRSRKHVVKKSSFDLRLRCRVHRTF